MKREVVQTKNKKKKKNPPNSPNPNPYNRTADPASDVTCSCRSASQPVHASGAAPPAPPRPRSLCGCAGASSAERPLRLWDPSSVSRGDRDTAAWIQAVSRVNRMGCYFKTEPVCIAQVELTLFPECFCFHIHILPSIADITIL